jgi:hypothetical protein
MDASELAMLYHADVLGNNIVWQGRIVGKVYRVLFLFLFVFSLSYVMRVCSNKFLQKANGDLTIVEFNSTQVGHPQQKRQLQHVCPTYPLLSFPPLPLLYYSISQFFSKTFTLTHYSVIFLTHKFRLVLTLTCTTLSLRKLRNMYAFVLFLFILFCFILFCMLTR